MRMFPFLLQNPAPLIFASLHTLPLCLSRSTDGAHTLRPSFSLTCPPRSLLHHYLQPTTPYHLILLRSNRFLVRCVIALHPPYTPFSQSFLVYLPLLASRSLVFCFLLPTVITQTFFCSSHFRDTIPPSRFCSNTATPSRYYTWNVPKFPRVCPPNRPYPTDAPLAAPGSRHEADRVYPPHDVAIVYPPKP